MIWDKITIPNYFDWNCNIIFKEKYCIKSVVNDL